MSKQIDDGGPAFPVAPFIQPNGDFDWGHDGMSMRDWFAGQALAGIMAAMRELKPNVTQEAIASECYELADAMLAASKSPKQQ